MNPSIVKKKGMACNCSSQQMSSAVIVLQKVSK